MTACLDGRARATPLEAGEGRNQASVQHPNWELGRFPASVYTRTARPSQVDVAQGSCMTQEFGQVRPRRARQAAAWGYGATAPRLCHWSLQQRSKYVPDPSQSRGAKPRLPPHSCFTRTLAPSYVCLVFVVGLRRRSHPPALVDHRIGICKSQRLWMRSHVSSKDPGTTRTTTTTHVSVSIIT